MDSQYLDLSHQYYERNFRSENSPASAERAALFFKNYDDWYHGYFKHYGDRVASLKALVDTAIVTFKETYGHMNLAYQNCAISSGTNPHLYAVEYNHHTSHKIAREIGNDTNTWRNIIDSSTRSLERAHRTHDLWPEMYKVTPAAFEGSTRVFQKGSGKKLTGGWVFDDADYMAFWNMVIDSCKGFILDDVTLDMPSTERVAREIELAKSWSKETRERQPINTSDWNNSRNSIYEMARGTYIQFGLHPLRPNADMDMRIYDQATHSLYPATLLARTKPVVQNILRWIPQGIAAEEACTTVARLFNLHRMRIDPEYNAKQGLSLDLDKIPGVLRDPTQKEIHEFNALIKAFEPFLLKYAAHLINTNGLPPQYKEAKEAMGIAVKHTRGHEITNGEDIVEWQRKNIPAKDALDLWHLTLPSPFAPETASPKRAPLHGAYVPQRRLHDFKIGPFQETENSKKEIWPDRPYDRLDEMSQDLARVVLGVLETGILPDDSPDYHGVRFDLKRGEAALVQMKENKVQDISLLPGALGRSFNAKVSRPNLKKSEEIVNSLRTRAHDNEKKSPQAVFGTPIVKTVNETIKTVGKNFAGPGPASPSPDFRLSLEMEMLRRNYTHIVFQKGWETSEDCTRMMVQAMKIEFGKIDRPGQNNTELSVLNEDGKYISLYERYERLRYYLNEVTNTPEIVKHAGSNNTEALQQLGIRHVSLALARIIEAYDCMIDQQFNNGRFEKQQVKDQDGLFWDLHKIQETKQQTIQMLLDKWVWLWTEKDFEGLRQDYRDAWLDAHGNELKRRGPEATDDGAITHRYGP